MHMTGGKSLIEERQYNILLLIFTEKIFNRDEREGGPPPRNP